MTDFSGTTFDRATGEVLGHFTRPADTMLVAIQTALAEGRGIVEGHVPHDHLIDGETGEAAPRPGWSLQTGPNEISGLPDGARVLIEGQWIEPEGGRVRVALEWPQRLRVIVQHPRHGDTEVTLQCEALAIAPASRGVARIAQDVSLLRGAAYDPLTDQFDTLIRGLAKLPGAALVPELKSLIDASVAVKARFPKG